MPAPECSVSKMQNSQPAFAMIWLTPGVKNSKAMWPSATPPLRSLARTGLPRIVPPVWRLRSPVPSPESTDAARRRDAQRQREGACGGGAPASSFARAHTTGPTMDSDVRTEAAHAAQEKTALDTPALLVDLDALDANIARMAACFRQHGVNWRPHTKGIKVPQIARRLIDAGAIGITCAKLGEAEVMAAAGIKDILIANQIVGAQKIARLTELRRHCDVIVAVDSADNVAALAEGARAAGLVLRVVVEVNIGMNRAGVEPGEPCVALAKLIAGKPELEFAGLMGWEGQTAPLDAASKPAAVSKAVGEIVRSAEQCRAAGLPVNIVSCGGTGTYWVSAAQPGITEIQAGGGVFCDVHYREHFGLEHPYALTVMTSVTSRPSPTRIVCD